MIKSVGTARAVPPITVDQYGFRILNRLTPLIFNSSVIASTSFHAYGPVSLEHPDGSLIQSADLPDQTRDKMRTAPSSLFT